MDKLHPRWTHLIAFLVGVIVTTGAYELTRLVRKASKALDLAARQEKRLEKKAAKKASKKAAKAEKKKAKKAEKKAKKQARREAGGDATPVADGSRRKGRKGRKGKKGKRRSKNRIAQFQNLPPDQQQAIIDELGRQPDEDEEIVFVPGNPNDAPAGAAVNDGPMAVPAGDQPLDPIEDTDEP